MAEYIDKQVALRHWPPCDEPADAYQYIKNFPAADVRSVVRGEWRKIGKIGCIFICSACDKTFPCKTDFCPNCGADMREAPDA